MLAKKKQILNFSILLIPYRDDINTTSTKFIDPYCKQNFNTLQFQHDYIITSSPLNIQILLRNKISTINFRIDLKNILIGVRACLVFSPNKQKIDRFSVLMLALYARVISLESVCESIGSLCALGFSIEMRGSAVSATGGNLFL